MNHCGQINSTKNNAEHDIGKIARRTRTTVVAGSNCAARCLSPNFGPGPTDVICSRGKEALVHEGNKTFERLLSIHLDAYSKATTKTAKTLIVSTIVGQIRNATPNGEFVAKQGGQWVEIGDTAAREKIGQSMRNMLHAKYKSSKQHKRMRRKEISANQKDEVEAFLKENNLDVTERIRHLSVSATSEGRERIDSDMCYFLRNYMKRGTGSSEISQITCDEYLAEKLQAAFNQANCELLDALKRRQNKNALAAFIAPGTSSNPDDFEPIPLEEAMDFHYLPPI